MWDPLGLLCSFVATWWFLRITTKEWNGEQGEQRTRAAGQNAVRHPPRAPGTKLEGGRWAYLVTMLPLYVWLSVAHESSPSRTKN